MLVVTDFVQCLNIGKRFILSLRKGVMCYEYIDSWGKYNEISLPPTKNFFSKLKNKGITDADYKHVQNHAMRLTQKK